MAVGNPTLTATRRGDLATVGAGAPAVAVVALSVSWALALASSVLWAVNRPPLGMDTWFFVVDVTVAVVYGGAGALVLWRRRHAVAWIFLLAAVGCGLSAFGAQYFLLGQTRDLPAEQFVSSMVAWGWVPGTLALVVVVPWLVRDTPLPRTGVALVAAGWVAAIGATLLRLTDPHPWPEGEPMMPLAISSEGWLAFVESAMPWVFRVVVLLGAVATVDVARRWRVAPDRSASGLGWLLIGSAAMALSFVPLTFPSNWFEGSVAVPTLTPVLHLVSQAFLPAATIVVVLRQRLWGIDLALDRTLVHSLLSFALIGVYAVIVVVADQALPGTGAPAAIAAAVVAVLVLPLRAWLQGRVDRLVHGAAAAGSTAALGQMGRVLERSDDPAVLVAGVAEHLATSMRLGSVRVWATDARGARHEVAAVGEPAGPQHTVALVRGADSVGDLVVSAPFGERLDARTLEALSALAPVVAATVELGELNAELGRASARLADARAEERRILRRDLHDGLGPALAGIGLGLQAYRNLLPSDAVAAERLLDRLCSEVDQRVEDVRQLSRQLLPPVLDEVGLGAALHELADRYRSAGITVELELSGVAALAGPVATTAYAIVAEALVNAHRHGGAGRASIRAQVRDGWLDVEVANDGAPIDADAREGIGLRSMRERAGELGGHVDVGCRSGSTVVSARLPVLEPAEVPR